MSSDRRSLELEDGEVVENEVEHEEPIDSKRRQEVRMITMTKRKLLYSDVHQFKYDRKNKRLRDNRHPPEEKRDDRKKYDNHRVDHSNRYDNRRFDRRQRGLSPQIEERRDKSRHNRPKHQEVRFISNIY